MPTYSAQRIINRALSTIGVLEAEESATSAQAVDALDTLNDILNEWDARGISGGYSDVELSDELILDPDEYRALRLWLALDLAPEYQAQVPPALAAMADESRRLLEAKYSRPKTLCLDDALITDGAYDIRTDS
jgi:hypothetical protein